ncbi:hypothetical protein EXIGLDRAFT_620083 [Exidia glandulosa HHB12029]|uniref:Uncharacterized protein n=1 Tax=Exidia glandulosa HHB12029 TaxID=1314781 RepID=A0A165EWR1_EXIGL|nr:hypothetical protein EXIGLDRAFT_620083 [Exidia glandulosa HHB12029]
MAPERIREVLERVKIGDDLSDGQRARVENLIREFADVFTLSLKEVRLVDFVEHKLGLPEGTTGPRMANQKPLTEPQREWLYKALDEMESCGGSQLLQRNGSRPLRWLRRIRARRA